jgi:hypothetical protein
MLKLSRRKAYRLFMSQKGIVSDGWKFRDLKGYHSASGLSLDSGAKLFYSRENGYMVTGYHYSGEDVAVYAKFGKLVKL